MFCFFFFKQKTAYEVRISDWSSDVCSSDLRPKVSAEPLVSDRLLRRVIESDTSKSRFKPETLPFQPRPFLKSNVWEIGRASCRERVCQYVSISVVAE